MFFASKKKRENKIEEEEEEELKMATESDSMFNEPIKISIYESDDGLFHMKYDDYEQEKPSSGSTHKPKQKRRNQSTKLHSEKSTEKSTTETLYEIDLFCEICNHDYKSLMSLNRHMKTRKHLNQLKMNEAKQNGLDNRDWNLLNRFDALQQGIYDPISSSLFSDSNKKSKNRSSNWSTTQCRECSNQEMGFGVNGNEYSSFMNQSSVYDNSYGNHNCLVCTETFSTPAELDQHSNFMQFNCSNLIDSINDDFDLQRELDILLGNST